MAAAAALLLALTLGAQTQLDASLRVEAAPRRSDPPTLPGERNALDLTAAPRLGLRVSGGGATASMVYSPRFSLLAVGPHSRGEQVQEGELRLQLARGPAFRLEAFGDGAAGRSDLVRESQRGGAGGGAPGTTTVLSTQQIDLERWRTGGSLTAAPDRRTELLLTGAVGQDGGTNARSRAVYPVARALDGTGELRWRATRLDRVGLLLAANQTRVARARANSAWASGLVTWRHAFAPDVEAWSGAGAVWLDSRVPATAPATGRTTETKLSPAAQLGISRTPAGPGTLGGELAGTLGASVDRSSGVATPRADAHASLRWPWTQAIALTATGSGSLTWSEQSRTRTGQIVAALSFALHPRLHLDLGGYGTWQRSTGPSAGDLDSYGGALSLSLEAPPVRF